MQRPYLLKLQDDRYHDMQLEWDGYEKEQKLLKQWLNEPNPKTGVRNWAEMAYEYCIVPRNAERSLTISYAYRKTLDLKKLTPNEFDDFDFPMIDLQ